MPSQHFDLFNQVVNDRVGYPPTQAKMQTWHAQSKLAFPAAVAEAGECDAVRSLVRGGKHYFAATGGNGGYLSPVPEKNSQELRA